ncbi:MAG: DUF4364 family protein [Ruminococcus sp.]|nr:DUF4364 family protein [Ruminococcus sp.]
MAFDTFDEGINYGGVRSKNEIRTLICYLFASVNKPMDKSTIIEAVQNQGLANYFETSSCFDDLISHNNIELVDEKNKLYFLTPNGNMVANQLENTLPISVKEKAYTCAITLLNEKRIEKESPVSIEKTDNGYNVNFRISGGDMDLVSIDVYAPDIKQAKIMKKNFHRNPEQVYKLIMGSLTKNKNIVNECLEEIKSSR